MSGPSAMEPPGMNMVGTLRFAAAIMKPGRSLSPPDIRIKAS